MLLAAVSADPQDAWLANLPQVKALATVWEQQCVQDTGGQWRFRKECLLKGSERVDSPHDLQARWSSKRGTTWTGYKVHLTETCDDDTPHLITQVETTDATVADLRALEVIQSDLDAAGLRPGEHFLDGGYVTVEIIAEAAAAGTIVIGPAANDSSWQARAGLGFDRDSFTIDWDTRIATCPNGLTSTEWHDARHSHGPGASIRFAATDCAVCPSRADCTRDPNGRKILIPPRTLHQIQLRNRSDQHDVGWQRRYDQRAGVEGTISEAVRAHGVRRCKYQGLDKTRVQHTLAACGINAARIADWHERGLQPAARRPRSPLKILCKSVTGS